MKKIIVALSILALSGCYQTNGKNVSNSGGSAGLEIVTLDDGTRCAVLVGYEKAAISCDWK